MQYMLDSYKAESNKYLPTYLGSELSFVQSSKCRIEFEWRFGFKPCRSMSNVSTQRGTAKSIKGHKVR